MFISIISMTIYTYKQVENYLRVGNVLIKGLSLTHENESLERLKQFFYDYGALINFTATQWRYVYFILYDKNDRNYRNLKNNTNNTENETKDKNETNTFRILSKDEKKKRKHDKMNDISNYHCVQENNRYVLNIPSDFKHAALLNFIRINLPMSSISAGYS